MALNLKNYQESQKISKDINIYGNAMKNTPIGISSNAHALKNATNGIDSKAIMNWSTKNPFPRKLPPHSCCQFKCKLEEDAKEGINLKKNSEEEKSKDLEINLKVSETSLDIQQETFSDTTSTFAQIQPSCASSKGPLCPNYPTLRPTKTKENVGNEYICLGCQNCYLYVLVPSDNPRCPNCFKNKYLIDIPSGNPTKRAIIN